MSEQNTQEKIDYIYATLKKQESRRIWSIISKWGFRILVLGYMYYFIKYGLPNMIDSLIPDFPSIGGSGTGATLDTIKNSALEYFSK